MKRLIVLTFKVVLLACAGLIVLSGVMIVRTLGLNQGQMSVGAVAPPAFDSMQAAKRLSGAIQIPTITHDDPTRFNASAFQRLRAYLEQTYPTAHAVMSKEVISGHSLLYEWKGKDKTLAPILLAAHLDVVPPVSPERWQHDPFSGTIEGGFIHGRGSLDDKASVTAILQAIELLATADYRPQRTILIAFGHDEERGGIKGAAKIAELLAQRKVELEFVLDEGTAVLEAIVPGVSQPVAMIGIAEKGYVSFELTAESRGGHSSMPPRITAAGRAARAIARLEESPMPARIDGATAALLERLAPEMPFIERAAIANQWLAAPMLTKRLTARPSSNAGVRTTMAATILQAGDKENSLATHARAVVNFRILPGDTVKEVEAYLKGTIDDPRVRIAKLDGATEPSKISSPSTPQFRLLERTARETIAGALVAPGLVVAQTDSRHYSELTDQIYRFMPVRMNRADLMRVHGIDERISIESYAEAIRFYYQLIKNAAIDEAKTASQ
ncbi:MAG: M20 family peptidase [Armatimonadetes bacterium]|nr:M20 family peptidase [Armatimonadota bacterium]